MSGASCKARESIKRAFAVQNLYLPTVTTQPIWSNGPAKVTGVTHRTTTSRKSKYTRAVEPYALLQ
jgi:hypothetical protein